MDASKRIDEIAARRGFVPGTFLTQDEYDVLVAKAAAQHQANEDNAPESITSDDDDDGDGGEPSPSSDGWRQNHFDPHGDDK